MAKLIYAMNMSVDGYTEDSQGGFNWGATNDVESHIRICEIVSVFGTHLYGRKMYEKMAYWENPDQPANLPEYLQHFARVWQAADKIVYSNTLSEPRSQRTRIERTFDPEAVRRLKVESERDINIAGPELASYAIRAGLVDELLMIVHPVIVGGGKRYLPSGVQNDLKVIGEERLNSGAVVLRYSIARSSSRNYAID
jgi:dihydrofolate reductase